MKVALCLSGLCHSFDEAYPSLKETIIDRYNPDIYCAFWKEDYTGIFESDATKAIMTLNPAGAEVYDQVNLVDEFMSQYFNPERREHFDEHWHKKTSEVITSWGRRNVLNMFFMIWNCNNLTKLGDPTPYDIVIRARPDRKWELNHELKTGNKIYFHHLKGNLSDWFAYGPPDLMDIYSDTWLKLPAVAGYREREDRDWLNPHKCLDTVLSFAGVEKQILERPAIRGHMVGEDRRREMYKQQRKEKGLD